MPRNAEGLGAARRGSRETTPFRPFHKPGAGCTACSRCWRSRRTAVSSSYPIEQTPTSGCICSSTPSTSRARDPGGSPFACESGCARPRERPAVGARAKRNCSVALPLRRVDPGARGRVLTRCGLLGAPEAGSDSLIDIQTGDLRSEPACLLPAAAGEGYRAMGIATHEPRRIGCRFRVTGEDEEAWGCLPRGPTLDRGDILACGQCFAQEQMLRGLCCRGALRFPSTARGPMIFLER
jgi:hypothetical protein